MCLIRCRCRRGTRANGALADLIPGQFLSMLRQGRTPWRNVLAEVEDAIRSYVAGWPEERVEDRAGLRLRLYREQSI